MNLHYRSDGEADGPVVLLAGSLGTTLELWEPQVDALSAEFRVVRYDHPGHGGSSLPDRGLAAEDLAAGVLQLLDELELPRVSFCGLSLGGVVGMALAAWAPDRIDRLVLCSTAARIGTRATWAERASTVRDEGMEAIADPVVGRWFTPEFSALRPETVRRYRTMVAATPPEGYARCCEVLAAFDLRAGLSAIEAPTLVLVGDRDPVISVDDATELARGIPQARLAVLSPAAHLANVERPEEFNRELVAHLSAGVAA
jgi:3-oxoadipate enol-lactonase